jgi:hypothetical protein
MWIADILLAITPSTGRADQAETGARLTAIC